MKIHTSALLSACLLASVPLSALAQTEPVIVEAENGTLGPSVMTGSLDGATYATAAVNVTTGPTGTDDPRVSTYQITFPAAGNYDLYARMRVGPNASNDDSWYFGNGFGVSNNWPLYNTSTGGFTDPAATVLLDGPTGSQVFKWVRITGLYGMGGLGPTAWTVPDGALTQTFYWSTREDGMFMDKFAFGRAGSCYTVADLDAGTAATGTCPPPPPPPPPPYEHSGPPMATGKDKFLGSAWSPGEASAQFDRYFNKLTLENAGKWGSIEQTRDVYNWDQAREGYALAKQNGWPFHWHVLVWGNQQPGWIEDLPPAEQLEEIRELWTLIAQEFPDIEILEVVNEPLHDAPFGDTNGNYGDALGGRAPDSEYGEWTWIVNAFKLAREIFPADTKLMLNDYSISNDGNATTRYLEIITLLQSLDLIDIIGDQGHGFSTTEPAPMPNHRANLDRLAATGLPIHITELDIPGLEDAVQLANYQRIFPVFWEHPGVAGVTLWGYGQNTHWRRTSGDWLMWGGASLGAQRPALAWLVSYVSNNLPVIGAQEFSVDENSANGTAVGTVTATDPDAGQTLSAWQIDSGSGVPVFEIDAATGAISVVDGTALDFETTASYTLNVSVYDGYRRSESSAVTVNVTNLNDNTPEVTAGQKFAVDGGSRNVLGAAEATDADDTNQPGFTDFQGWRIVGGTGAKVFAIGSDSGVIRASRPLKIDWRKSSYTLVLKTSDGANTSPQQTVTITIPNRVKTCFYGADVRVSKRAVPILLLLGGTLGTCRAP